MRDKVLTKITKLIVGGLVAIDSDEKEVSLTVHSLSDNKHILYTV